MLEKIFNKSDYINVHNYALKYKEGDKESGEKLIESFNLFIYKYAHFLSYGVYDINNYSLRNFISLYINNKVYRKQLPNYKHKPFIKTQFSSYASNTSMLFQKYTFDELYNECVCVLLNMAKRYKDTRPSFHNYVFRCYHYELERALKHLIKDPLVKTFIMNNDIESFKSMELKQDNQEEDIIEALNKEINIKNAETITIDDITDSKDIESLNYNWISGVTCSEEFSELTSFQREILVSNYIHNKTDTQIAEELGLCRATVNRKKTQAKKELYDRMVAEKKIKNNGD